MVTLIKLKNVVFAGINTLIGLAFLVWSFFIGAGVLRFLLLGETTGLLPDIASWILGILFVALLVWLWRCISKEDREDLVNDLWRFFFIFIFLALSLWWKQGLLTWPLG